MICESQSAVRAHVTERAAPAEALPREIAFLDAYGVPRAALVAAARHAADLGTSAARTLIAEGGVSETLYALALARHLGVPFVETWPRFHEAFDPIVALRRGCVRLAAAERATWLMAPTDHAIAMLLRAHDRPDVAVPDIMITTPAHFCTIVQQRGRQAIAHAASDALPEQAPHLSAKGATTLFAGLLAVLALSLCIGGFFFQWHLVSDIVGTIFFAGMVFRLLVCAAGLGAGRGAAVPQCSDRALPTYTVLVALHREAAIAPRLVASLAALDYPQAKMEVFFLLEQNDGATRDALLAANPPANFRVITVPAGEPRTKPRALNVGLMLAKGELLTVFDAEDRPDPDQLRKAAALFATASPRVACVQARLAIANAANGLLPCLFAIEYAALFDLFNVGIARGTLPMALGGTSNHFRTAVLRKVGGWDAWNVTEDADLGLRLSRFGYHVDALDSTTWEIALEAPVPWLKQRRRWIKGWLQTLLVLARDGRVIGEFGIARSLAVMLLLTTLVAGPLLTPLAIAAVVWHLALNGVPSPHGPVETLEATLASTVAVLGILSPLWCSLAGARVRAIASASRRLPFVLPYNMLVSIAAWLALWDLVRAPYHWHKTDHTHAAVEGLVLATAVSRSSP
jgi:hypothetical protein